MSEVRSQHVTAGMPAMAETSHNGMGDFGGREQLIPAVYSITSLAEQFAALPPEDSVTSLLAARWPPTLLRISVFHIHLCDSCVNEASWPALMWPAFPPSG